jgi:hypothetical protein
MSRSISCRVIALATLSLSSLVPVAGSLGPQGGTSTLVAGVADAETGAPLEGAEVLLVKLHRLGRANALGEATVTEVPRGVQRVRVRRLGYSPAEVDLAVSRDTTGAVFRLTRVATQLGAVKIEAQWVPPGIRDFETRRKQGIGRFMIDTELDEVRNRDFSTMAQARFAGLTTVVDANGKRVLATQRGLTPCPVNVYLDGIELGQEYDDWVRTWDLAAVEFYSGSQVPVRYRTKLYGCGVFLLWSKWY